MRRTKIKEIQVIFNGNTCGCDPLDVKKTVAVKMKTNNGVKGRYIVLPETADTATVVKAINVILKDCRGMVIK